ncbi:MAG: lysophospholipid acyltransferase family protein [Candidatus Zixiibacteriota bacterium]
MSLPYYIGRKLVRLISRLVFRVQITGIENIPMSGGFILACNHISYCDPPLVGSWVSREMYFLAKKELMDYWGFGALLRSLNALPLKRDAIDRRAIELGVEKIREGYGLVIFPEGTRSKADDLLPGRAGVGVIAKEAECPIVPTYVFGTNRLSRCLAGAKRLRISYGRPIPVDWIVLQPHDKSGYQAITEEVMARIRRLREAVQGGALSTETSAHPSD